MNLINYIIYFVIFIAILNLAWPLLIALFLYLMLQYVYAKWSLIKTEKTRQKQEAYYETMETRKQGLDIIDVEYEEKK